MHYYLLVKDAPVSANVVTINVLVKIALLQLFTNFFSFFLSFFHTFLLSKYFRERMILLLSGEKRKRTK